MTKQQIREVIQHIIKQDLKGMMSKNMPVSAKKNIKRDPDCISKGSVEEEAPTPSKPKETPKPAVAPGKPSIDKPIPRRPLGNPNVKPAPKATMTEANILAKIIKRFKSKKVNEVDAPSPWERGYKEGYRDGYKDAKENKLNKLN